jgi:DHA3 family tetracycline resistance protein-like MFS transporter
MNALTVYMILEFSSSLFYSLIFTANQVYYLTVVKLNPLQLVLVGTILETTAFLFEIPTGVVADVKSRRLSVITGYFLIGLGFIIEGSLPLFSTVALAQVVWGIGYTFTSGATQAWIADEIGEKRAGEAFLRGAQAARVGALLAIPMSVALGRIAVALPITLGGACMILLACFLIAAMPEEGFAPSPIEDRTTLALMLKTVRDARQLTRRQPMLLTLLGIGFFYGLYSEGLDRLWSAHLLQDFAIPWIEVLQPLVWFGIIRAVQQVISLVATEVARRRVYKRRSAPIAQVLRFNAAWIVVALAAFGLTRAFWLALVLYWSVQVLRSVNGPLQNAWLNQRIDDSQIRATMFSVSSQVDAIGQISGGPLVGVIGNSISVRAALIASALMLSPVLPLYSIAIRRSGQQSTLTKQMG